MQIYIELGKQIWTIEHVFDLQAAFLLHKTFLEIF